MTDRALGASGALDRLGAQIGADLSTRQVARVPMVEGVPFGVMARFVARSLSARRWVPLVLTEPTAAPADHIDDLLELARGGLVGVPSGQIGVEAQAALFEAGIGLLLPGEPAAGGAALRLALLREDRHHLVATDPSLQEVRRSLLAHCRGNSPVHLTGPMGTGKRSLCAWAHATLDDRPLTVIARGSGRQAAPGRWSRWDELGELSADQVVHLRQALAAAEPGEVGWRGPAARVARPQHPAFQHILGRSAALVGVLHDVLRVGPLGVPVLIRGESGVGKESLARAVHDASGRAGPYRALDLSTINEGLVESELFGHVRGAFTGADRDRPGAFRAAQGGTLFLDELGNLSPRVQAKLLRVLQERVVQPVGSDQLLPVDVRVIAATHADLEGMVARGQFREDLVRRLDAVTLRLPALRERSEDIALLGARFYAEHGGRLREDWASPAAIEALVSWPWPGNVRELGHVIARAVAEAGGGRVEVQHLGPLAPGERRAVPLLTTASDEAWTRSDAFAADRSLCHRLTAVTLRLAPLRERPAASVRNAVLTLLDGHPIARDAMGALERYPWWGNGTELSAAVAALRANIPGRIDRAAIEGCLPHLLRAAQAPIRLRLHPTVTEGPDGRQALGGFCQDFHEAALLIGRVASLAQATQQARLDPALEARLAALRALLRGASLGVLDLGHLPQLSRLHLLLSRDGEGLQVTTLPEARLPVWAGPLDGPLRAVPPGERCALGRGGELRLGSAAGPADLHLFVFAGAIAEDEQTDRALARLLQGRGLPGRTVDLRPVVAPPPAPEEARPTVWELDPAEIDWLADLVAGFDGLDFKAAIERASRAVEGQAALARLCRYLACARPTQYAGRLYEHPRNGALRAATAARLGDLDDPEAQLGRLPTAIRRAVEGREA